jgi:hypothetical protein
MCHDRLFEEAKTLAASPLRGNSKFQTQNSKEIQVAEKLQIPSKLQAAKSESAGRFFWNLILAIWNFFGIYWLDFGISS